MYIPKYYKNENPEDVRAFINENGFAILVSLVNKKPWATHIPLILSKNPAGKEILSGHLSKANSQWKEFDNPEEVLVIFSGPHTYVSSSWYDHENVPTWNYIAVHVYGRIKIIQGEILKKQLADLVDKYETGMEHPVSVDRMSEEFVKSEMKGIIGFEIEITEIQAVRKLSQNRDDKNYQMIIKELEKQGYPDSVEIARLMKNKK